MIKRLIPLMVCLLLGGVAFAQGGVEFRDLTFDEALVKAKAEKKLVFVDCYTAWCAPCKAMAKDVFPQKAAGDFFNPRFVCVKFDVQKGEGVEVGKKLGTRAYPSFFIIRPDGKVQHAIVGGCELDVLIKRVERGLNEKTSLLYLDTRYQQGKLNKKQLLDYKMALKEADNQAKVNEIQKELAVILTEKDKVKAYFWPFFAEAQVGSAEMDFVLAHLPELEKNVGKEKLDQYLDEAYSNVLNSSVKAFHAPVNGGGEKPDLNKLKEQVSNLKIARQPLLMMKYNMLEAATVGDAKKLMEVLDAGVEQLDDIWLASITLQKVSGKATKEELSHMAALGEKISAQQADDYTKKYFAMLADNYRRRAHTGIYFDELSFEEALEKAKKSNKLLFVDCYTSWCGPCKILARDVFTDSEVGDYFNEHFISLKVDCEKGEGPRLRERFGVAGFPTLLFLNGEGEVVSKMVGASKQPVFLQKVKEGLDPNTSVYGKEKQYKAGKRDRAFVLDLITSYRNQREYKKSREVSLELLATLSEKELLTEEMWEVVQDYFVSGYGSEWWNFILKHSDEYAKLVGKEAVANKIGSTMHPYLFGFACGNDKSENRPDFVTCKKLVDRYQPAQKEILYAFIELGKSACSNNFNGYFQTVLKVVPKLDISEHYRFFANALGHLVKNANAKQKQQLLTLLKESQKRQSDYFKPLYQEFLDQVGKF